MSPERDPYAPGAAVPPYGATPGPYGAPMPQGYAPVPYGYGGPPVPGMQPYGYAPPGYGYPVARPRKDSTVAWMLWLFLGGFGAHHFYLDRPGWGVAYVLGWFASFMLLVVGIGVLGMIALFVLWIVDAAKMSERLDFANGIRHY